MFVKWNSGNWGTCEFNEKFTFSLFLLLVPSFYLFISIISSLPLSLFLSHYLNLSLSFTLYSTFSLFTSLLYISLPFFLSSISLHMRMYLSFPFYLFLSLAPGSLEDHILPKNLYQFLAFLRPIHPFSHFFKIFNHEFFNHPLLLLTRDLTFDILHNMLFLLSAQHVLTTWSMNYSINLCAAE